MSNSKLWEQVRRHIDTSLNEESVKIERYFNGLFTDVNLHLSQNKYEVLDEMTITLTAAKSVIALNISSEDVANELNQRFSIANEGISVNDVWEDEDDHTQWRITLNVEVNEQSNL